MKQVVKNIVSSTSRWQAVVLAGVLGVSLLGAANEAHAAEPTVASQDGWLSKITYQAGDNASGTALREKIIADINNSRVRVWAALMHLEDTAIADALVSAHKRGVEVRIVSDADHKSDVGFGMLEAAGIKPVYGDGELAYLPEPTITSLLQFCQRKPDVVSCTKGSVEPGDTEGIMVRAGDFNLMSHTFFVIDEMQVWNITTPLTTKNTVWLGFNLLNEEVARSFEREFRQMHGGVFSTTLSIYNGPLKSNIQRTPLYITDQGSVKIQFNPQERLLKNVIDEVYRAKASIFIMTEDLSNPFLIDALEYKINNGFDVKVVIGNGQGQSMQARVDAIGAKKVSASTGFLPTMLILDHGKDRRGKLNPRIVQLLSHPLYRTAAFDVERRKPDDIVRWYRSDAFVDGNMFEILEFGNQRVVKDAEKLPAEDFVKIWEKVWAGAQ